MEEIQKSDLIHLLESSKVYNRLLIKNNAEYVKLREIMETTRDNQAAGRAINKAVEIQKQNAELAKAFRFLDFINVLPEADYLLVINYLFNDNITQEELMDAANISTPQKLYSRVRQNILDAFIQHYG